MLNLLGRARKGSTFSPSEGGGYKLPPTRNKTQAPAPRRKAPARPYRDDYEKYLERERKKYRAKEQRELERRFRSYQKTIEDIQDMAENYREPLEFAVDLTPWRRVKDALLLWQKVVPAVTAGFNFEASGWTKFCPGPVSNPGGAYQIRQRNDTAGYSGWCNLSGQPYHGTYPMPIPVGTIQVAIGVGINRMVFEEVWRRAPGTGQIPVWQEAQAPSTTTYVLPPEPVLPNRAPKADLTPAIGKVPNPLPYQRPALVWEPKPDGRMKMTRGYHNVLRPGRQRKEIKLRMRNMLQPLIGATTEAVEWIDMLHDNLPKHLQAKGDYDRFGNYKGKGKGDPTPQEKLKAVYLHINEIDHRNLVMDIVKNHYEDKFFGKLGEAGGKLARDANWLIGPQAGFGL